MFEWKNLVGGLDSVFNGAVVAFDLGDKSIDHMSQMIADTYNNPTFDESQIAISQTLNIDII